MTDTPSKRRWMPVVLALSLALNLAVVAAVAGATWRHKGSGGPSAGKGGGTIYLQALPPDARRALRGEMRRQPRVKLDSAVMVTALRQEPFDAEAAGRALDTQRDNGLARYDAGRAVLLDHIKSMSAQDRAAYADRIEEIVQRRKDRKQRK
jgi:uncharacterized membrane protein